MSRALHHRLVRLETAALARLPVAPIRVFIPKHPGGTPENDAEVAEWKRAHPGDCVIVRVYDARRTSPEEAERLAWEATHPGWSRDAESGNQSKED